MSKKKRTDAEIQKGHRLAEKLIAEREHLLTPINKPRHSFEIEFLLGTPSARILDLGAKRHLDVALEETVTEQTSLGSSRNS